MKSGRFLTWVEIDRDAIAKNVRQFKNLVGEGRKLLIVVKANAYGHGMLQVAKIALESGADWLGVHSLDEAITLRERGFACPILVMGYIMLKDLRLAVEHDLGMGVASLETLEELAKICSRGGRKARVHVKMETGLNRLGLQARNLSRALRIIRSCPNLILEGVYTHFANIEDTTQHAFAMGQLRIFEEICRRLQSLGWERFYRHTACTAAALLFPETYFDILRVGIGAYGMWPSKETLITFLESRRPPMELHPALTWKSRIAQFKTVRPGETVGYGRSFHVTRPSRMAVIPVGYADGYDRKLSNRAHVLIRGKEAPVMGRICMNMFMVDVTHIPGVTLEDEIVLLGRQKGASITAEHLAELVGTINYEITTRIFPGIPRVLV